MAQLGRSHSFGASQQATGIHLGGAPRELKPAACVFVTILSGMLAAGCAPRPSATLTRVETAEQKYARAAAEIEANPVKFMRQVADRVAKMGQYRLTFYRQERNGIPPQLGLMEEIQASFRKQPFSVKFAWESADMPYFESVYVEGLNNNLLIVRERKGALPFLPPMVRTVDVMFPVKIGKSKNPITDFGLDRIMQRSLLPFDDPNILKTMTIKYEGLAKVEPLNGPVYCLRIERPKSKGITYTRQDLYFDADTLLPAGTDLYLPDEVLDVRYRYKDVVTSVHFTGNDFCLSKNHPTQPATTTAPAKK